MHFCTPVFVYACISQMGSGGDKKVGVSLIQQLFEGLLYGRTLPKRYITYVEQSILHVFDAFFDATPHLFAFVLSFVQICFTYITYVCNCVGTNRKCWNKCENIRSICTYICRYVCQSMQQQMHKTLFCENNILFCAMT